MPDLKPAALVVAAAAAALPRPLPCQGPFAGQVAIVTGSESGIGRETARALGQQGAAVVLNGRNAARLEQTRRNWKPPASPLPAAAPT